MQNRRGLPARLDAALFDDDGPGVDRFGLMLITTVATLTVLSLVDLYPDESNAASRAGTAVVTLALCALLLLTARAVGLRRRWRRVVVVIAGVNLCVSGIFVLAGETASGGANRPSTLWVLIALAMPIVVVRRILHHQRVELSTLLGAISAYLLIAFTFTFAFLEVDGFQSTPFFGQSQPTTSFMYFSLTSISTLGYGDLVAVTNLGRLLATTEAVAGQMFLVTLVAALVGRFTRRPGRGAAAPPR